MSYAQIRSTVIGAALACSLIAVAGPFAERALAQGENGPVLNPEHPETYVVQPGDTLWDIAATFLRDPWYWPEIWQINPQVANPHLIYPGDRLSLAYLDDGSPVIQLTRGTTGTGAVERLSPAIRTEAIEQAIPSIPYETLRAFLTRPAVLSPAEIDSLPYIFAHPDGLLGSAGRDVYVRGADLSEGEVFSIVHRGDALVDPDDGDVLGYQGIYVGEGRIRRAGDPATVYLIESSREASIGDYLIEEEQVAPMTFFPSAPVPLVEGRIMSVFDGVSVLGQYQVLVINRGARDGIEPGNVLSVYRTGETVIDPTLKNSFSDQYVRLPDELSGTTMVFRVFERMSYALVMQSTREIRVLDTIRNPES